MSQAQPDVVSRTSKLVAGRLMLRYCALCDRHYAAWLSICSSCTAADLPLRESSGQGQLSSWVIYHREYTLPFDLPVPYSVVAVDLTEGPRVNGLLAPSRQAADLRHGLAVALDTPTSAATDRPVFQIVESAGASA